MPIKEKFLITESKEERIRARGGWKDVYQLIPVG